MSHINSNEKSAIERCTEAIVLDLDECVRSEYAYHRPQISEKEYRRILALYLNNKTLKDWCTDLGIPMPEEETPN